MESPRTGLLGTGREVRREPKRAVRELDSAVERGFRQAVACEEFRGFVFRESGKVCLHLCAYHDHLASLPCGILPEGRDVRIAFAGHVVV